MIGINYRLGLEGLYHLMSPIFEIIKIIAADLKVLEQVFINKIRLSHYGGIFFNKIFNFLLWQLVNRNILFLDDLELFTLSLTQKQQVSMQPLQVLFKRLRHTWFACD